MANVSTIIPAFNAQSTIGEAIDSALSQECDDHEVVVVNDGSTDSTGVILEGYANRIRVVTQPNRGLSAARNAGVRSSTGKYLAFLDADDIWLPAKLQKMIPILQRTFPATLVFSECRFIDKNGVVGEESSLGHAPSMEELLTRLVPILPSTWVVTRQVLERVGGFCEKFRGAQGFEDTWLLLLLREQGYFAHVSDALTLYRVSDFNFAEKYASGLPVFISLTKERYGARGRSLIRDTKRRHCRSLLSKVAHQMNKGDKLGALHTLALILFLWPGYFLRAEFMFRLFEPQNTRRVWQMISALPKTRSS